MHFWFLCMSLLFRSSSTFLVPSRHSFAAPCSRRTTLRAASSSSSLVGKPLISVEQALEVHGDPNVKFIDGSWFLKGRNGRQEFEEASRISGALFFDIDDIASKGTTLNPKGLLHMMPPKSLFAAAMDAMGVSNTNHLIVYASQGCVSTSAIFSDLLTD